MMIILTTVLLSTVYFALVITVLKNSFDIKVDNAQTFSGAVAMAISLMCLTKIFIYLLTGVAI